jgi:hypothetical protein
MYLLYLYLLYLIFVKKSDSLDAVFKNRYLVYSDTDFRAKLVSSLNLSHVLRYFWGFSGDLMFFIEVQIR